MFGLGRSGSMYIPAEIDRLIVQARGCVWFGSGRLYIPAGNLVLPDRVLSLQPPGMKRRLLSHLIRTSQVKVLDKKFPSCYQIIVH